MSTPFDFQEEFSAEDAADISFNSARSASPRRSTVALVLAVAVMCVAAIDGWSPTSHRGEPVKVASGPLETIDPPTTSTTEAPTTTSTVPAPTTTVPKPATTEAKAPVTAAKPAPTAPKPTAKVVPKVATVPARAKAGPSAASAGPPPLGSGEASSYQDLGTWVDVYDFDPAHAGGTPVVTPATVDRMAAAGIHTIYLQAARPQDPISPGDLVQPALLAEFLQRAHAHGMRVVGWYLPYLSNVDDDMRHLSAILAFSASGHRFDSVALDIEWRNSVPDNATRSAQLVALSSRLRGAASQSGRLVGAIVMPPVVTDVINPSFWPGFPWHQMAPYYDVWLPMSYWSNRSDPTYSDAYRYTFDNIRLLRQDLGNANAVVHAIGGIGNASNADDYRGFMRACNEQGVSGRSVYDWATTSSDALSILRS